MVRDSVGHLYVAFMKINCDNLKDKFVYYASIQIDVSYIRVLQNFALMDYMVTNNTSQYMARIPCGWSYKKLSNNLSVYILLFHYADFSL